MIHICEPVIGDAERALVKEALDANQLSGHGDMVSRFEQSFASWLRAPHAVMTPNGTIALHLALAALGVGKGDAVILPASTISCCLFPVTMLGAMPVIVDVDPVTWCMDINQVAAALEKLRSLPKRPRKTVVMPVHLFGMPVNMPALHKLVSDCKGEMTVFIVEDCAEALGSKIRIGPHSKPLTHGQEIPWRVGNFGIMGCFSFFGNKTITTGEGGMVVTPFKEVDLKLRFLRNNAYQRDPEDRWFASMQAYNYRPTNLAAAIGLGQMQSIGELIDARQDVVAYYRGKLPQDFLTWQQAPAEWATPAWWMAVGLLPAGVSRRAFIEHMAELGVETRPTFPSLADQPYIHSTEYPHIVIGHEVAQDIWRRGVMLPTGAHLTRYQCDYIIECVLKSACFV